MTFKEERMELIEENKELRKSLKMALNRARIERKQVLELKKIMDELLDFAKGHKSWNQYKEDYYNLMIKKAEQQKEKANDIC